MNRVRFFIGWAGILACLIVAAPMMLIGWLVNIGVNGLATLSDGIADWAGDR